MKRYLFLAALACSFGNAIAADMPQPTKATVPVAASNQSGVYFGATAFADKTRGNFGTADITPSGTMGGIVAGYAAFAGQALFAVEFDAGYDLARDQKPCGFADMCDMKPTWFMSQRLVVGMPLASLTGAVQRATTAQGTQWPVPLNVPASLSAATALPYLTAGIAERRFQTCIDGDCNKLWRAGWAAGGGFRVPISAGITADIGYLYVGYRKHAVDTLPGFSPASEQIAKVSLHYHM